MCYRRGVGAVDGGVAGIGCDVVIRVVAVWCEVVAVPGNGCVLVVGVVVIVIVHCS